MIIYYSGIHRNGGCIVRIMMNKTKPSVSALSSYHYFTSNGEHKSDKGFRRIVKQKRQQS